jgi:Trypsin-like peptidase domain
VNSDKAQELFLRHAPCMAYVAVKNADGDENIGSAFHVGEGVFVTARHVVDGLQIMDVKPTHLLRLPLKEVNPEYTDEEIKSMTEMYRQEPTRAVFQNSLRVTKGPLFHSDAELDVAVFATEGLHPKTPHVKLGTHLDDWIVRTNFVLSEVLVLGYPPIPLTREPALIAARAEVNAVVTLPPSPKSHFIVSATPRGGFSGGLALSEYDFALGLISSSLTNDHKAAELGFMAVISVEPIYECLALHKLLPECQKVGWNDFWNTDHWDYVVKGDIGLEGKATVSLYNDGKRLYVELYCREPSAMERCLEAVARLPESNEVTHTSDMHARITFKGDQDKTLMTARNVVAVACEVLANFGYQAGPLHGMKKLA